MFKLRWGLFPDLNGDFCNRLVRILKKRGGLPHAFFQVIAIFRSTKGTIEKCDKGNDKKDSGKKHSLFKIAIFAPQINSLNFNIIGNSAKSAFPVHNFKQRCAKEKGKSIVLVKSLGDKPPFRIFKIGKRHFQFRIRI